VIEVRSVSKSYALRSPILQRPVGMRMVLAGVSFTIVPGETVGLLGASGSGKTTIARLLCRLDTPDSGEILIDGRPAAAFTRREYARQVQMVFQNPHASLNPRLSVRYLLTERARQCAWLDGRRVDRPAIAADVERACESAGLSTNVLTACPHQLSGGQRQRVAILMAVMLRPRLLILDEPLSALDVSLQAQMLNLLNDLQRTTGFTYLFITHDRDLAGYFCNRIVHLVEGRLADGAPI